MKLLKTIQLKCGQTYLMRTDDGNILEVGDVFMSVEKEVEIDETLFILLAVPAVSSINLVTNFSDSSGPAPSYFVTIVICGYSIEGYNS